MIIGRLPGGRQLVTYPPHIHLYKYIAYTALPNVVQTNPLVYTINCHTTKAVSQKLHLTCHVHELLVLS